MQHSGTSVCLTVGRYYSSLQAETTKTRTPIDRPTAH